MDQEEVAAKAPDVAAANASSVRAIKELVIKLESTEVLEIEEFAREYRLGRPFPFMKLPVEIRHLIYEEVVTPEMAQAHVVKNKIPALFNVNHEFSQDFAAFYFGPKVFKVELLTPGITQWNPVVDPMVVQIMFENQGGCRVEESLRDIKPLRTEEEIYNEDPPFDDEFRRGVLICVGREEKGVECSFWTEAQLTNTRGERLKYILELRQLMERSKAREEKLRRAGL